jgi:2-polyprenyl-6-methoxyphenol hydroxylase-like FAD-dependent oxidoreductase
MMRVLVIGGGIGGLCLAQGLRRAGVEVAVYERDRSRTDRLEGFRIHINPAGSRALHACLTPRGWQEFLATAGNPAGGFTFLTEQLEQLVHVDEQLMYGASDDPAERQYPVDRTTLRHLLLDGLDDTVRFDRTFERYAVDPDGRVTAHFADGSTATGDVLVGADGAGSRARVQYLPGNDRVGTGAFAVGHKLPLTAQTREWLPPRLATGMNLILAPVPYFLFTAVFERGGPGDYVLCAFVCRDDLRPPGARDLDGAGLQAAVGDLIRGWHPDLRRLVAESDQHSVALVPLTSSVPPPVSASSCVTLLGDAAHTMPPVGGLGGNTALRDAYLLCRQLIATDRGRLALPAAIADYETRMRRYSAAAVRATLKTQQQGLAHGRLAMAAARAWFRGCAAVPALRRLTFGTTWAAHARRLPWEGTDLDPAGDPTTPSG